MTDSRLVLSGDGVLREDRDSAVVARNEVATDPEAPGEAQAALPTPTMEGATTKPAWDDEATHRDVGVPRRTFAYTLMKLIQPVTMYFSSRGATSPRWVWVKPAGQIAVLPRAGATVWSWKRK